MNTPDFFDTVPAIIMQDRLADFLGAAEDGILEYTYLDAVKLAGHSCPTVAGAWLMCAKALKELYLDEIPQRGEIKVESAGALDEGVNGVIGTVAGLITGATNEGGFKGINGNFSRNDKLLYGADIKGELRFTRLDTMKSVDVSYDPSSIPGSPLQMQLMQKLMMKKATPEEAKEFGRLWQERVKRVLEAGDDLITVTP
jgi:formylmethanofuran dehydrogenase subunit E